MFILISHAQTIQSHLMVIVVKAPCCSVVSVCRHQHIQQQFASSLFGRTFTLVQSLFMVCSVGFLGSVLRQLHTQFNLLRLPLLGMTMIIMIIPFGKAIDYMTLQLRLQ